MPEDYSAMVRIANFNSMSDEEQNNFRKQVAKVILFDSWRYGLFCELNAKYLSKAQEEAHKFTQKNWLPLDQLDKRVQGNNEQTKDLKSPGPKPV